MWLIYRGSERAGTGKGPDYLTIIKVRASLRAVYAPLCVPRAVAVKPFGHVRQTIARGNVKNINGSNAGGSRDAMVVSVGCCAACIRTYAFVYRIARVGADVEVVRRQCVCVWSDPSKRFVARSRPTGTKKKRNVDKYRLGRNLNAIFRSATGCARCTYGCFQRFRFVLARRELWVAGLTNRSRPVYIYMYRYAVWNSTACSQCRAKWYIRETDSTTVYIYIFKYKLTGEAVPWS